MIDLYALALMFTAPLLGLLGLVLGHLPVPKLVWAVLRYGTNSARLPRLTVPPMTPLRWLALAAVALPLVLAASLGTLGYWLAGANAGLRPITTGIVGCAAGAVLAAMPLG